MMKQVFTASIEYETWRLLEKYVPKYVAYRWEVNSFSSFALWILEADSLG